MAAPTSTLQQPLEFWESLKDDILCREGKKLVSKDPNLSDETIRRLFALLPKERKKCEFFFSSDEDVGFSLVSSCIKDNTFATMAEMAARYCEMRNIPFAEAAKALVSLRKEGRLFYFNNNYEGGYTQIKWEPRLVTVYNKPPVKKAI